MWEVFWAFNSGPIICLVVVSVCSLLLEHAESMFSKTGSQAAAAAIAAGVSGYALGFNAYKLLTQYSHWFSPEVTYESVWLGCLLPLTILGLAFIVERLPFTVWLNGRDQIAGSHKRGLLLGWTAAVTPVLAIWGGAVVALLAYVENGHELNLLAGALALKILLVCTWAAQASYLKLNPERLSTSVEA